MKVIKVGNESIKVTHRLLKKAPLFVFNGKDEGDSSNIILSGNFRNGDIFSFTRKTAANGIYVHSENADLHEMSSSAPVKYIELSMPPFSEYVIYRMMFISAMGGWVFLK